MSEKKACKFTSIGGSALIEGVMMRGKGRLALAVRRADGRIQMKVAAAMKLKDAYSLEEKL